MDPIVLPYKPRNWARKMHGSLKRWAVIVLHRRAGKTTGVLNHHVRAAMSDDWEMKRLRFLLPDASDDHLAPLLIRRVYWHVMPQRNQAKRVGWEILKAVTHPIPGTKYNNQDLEVTLPTGNKIALIGADHPDTLRGPALSGCSLDEYSDISERAFGEVISKALADHLGYAIFAGTIKGKDQLYRLYHGQPGAEPPVPPVSQLRDWFGLWQDVDESLRTESGSTITALLQAMDDERKLVRDGRMTQAEFDQEWYLSADASIRGAFYELEMIQARKDQRITHVQHDPALPVDTDWDLGIDAMAVWFSQSDRAGNIRLIDYHEDVGGGLPAVIKVCQEKAAEGGWQWGKHWAPHDIEVREISSGLTRRQAAASLGIHFEITPRIAVADGITAAQLIMARCWWDEERCSAGLEALRHYRRSYNTRLEVFSAEPVHDIYSHGADAFRGLAVRHKVPADVTKRTARRREWSWS
jgi:phage terminase large subunit